jgi:DNA adenine methylase
MCEEGDFIFLDPPYDTEFSEYETKAFGKEEHKRLAECIYKTKAKLLLIIKNTPFIASLYEDKGLNIFAFDNKYAYCVKGRNDRNAEHLIITNY